MKEDGMRSSIGIPCSNDVRHKIWCSTPKFMQPFLSWLTACAVSTADCRPRTPRFYILLALAQTIGGIALSWTGSDLESGFASIISVSLGMLVTTAGLGLFQVGIFHYSAHHTLLDTVSANRKIGSFTAAVFFFGDFDNYRKRHMRHHSHSIIITEEDEFVEFIIAACGLYTGTPKLRLWKTVISKAFSPIFHTNFLLKRLASSNRCLTCDSTLIAVVLWTLVLTLVQQTGDWTAFTMSVLFPFTFLFQISVLLRTLCEHVVPPDHVRSDRQKDFSSHASRGVFAGVAPPLQTCRSLHGVLAWIGWWTNMLTVQLVFRSVILVGDAACHDLHHRRPGSRAWIDYMLARFEESALRSQLGESPYPEVWGLLATVDTCLASIASCSDGLKPELNELPRDAYQRDDRPDLRVPLGSVG